MIIAQFFYAKGHCTGCTVMGHADYAESSADIVCASVSSAVQTVANLMTEIYHLPILAEENQKTATIVIRLEKSDDSENADRLFAGLEMQFQLLEKTYPKYIQLKHMEV